MGKVGENMESGPGIPLPNPLDAKDQSKLRVFFFMNWYIFVFERKISVELFFHTRTQNQLYDILKVKLC